LQRPSTIQACTPANWTPATPREIVTVPQSPFLATMSQPVGAGFFASIAGPLPFAFGRVPPEKTVVFDFNSLLPAPTQTTP